MPSGNVPTTPTSPGAMNTICKNESDCCSNESDTNVSTRLTVSSEFSIFNMEMHFKTILVDVRGVAIIWPRCDVKTRASVHIWHLNLNCNWFNEQMIMWSTIYICFNYDSCYRFGIHSMMMKVEDDRQSMARTLLTSSNWHGSKILKCAFIHKICVLNSLSNWTSEKVNPFTKISIAWKCQEVEEALQFDKEKTDFENKNAFAPATWIIIQLCGESRDDPTGRERKKNNTYHRTMKGNQIVEITIIYLF